MFGNIRILEATVAHHFCIEAAFTGVIDLLEEDAVKSWADAHSGLIDVNRKAAYSRRNQGYRQYRDTNQVKLTGRYNYDTV